MKTKFLQLILIIFLFGSVLSCTVPSDNKSEEKKDIKNSNEYDLTSAEGLKAACRDISYVESIKISNQVSSRAVVDNPVLGDVNSDGYIDIVDALLTAQYYVGLNPDGFNTDTADVDESGIINILDALFIAQYYVGIIDKLPPINADPLENYVIPWKVGNFHKFFHPLDPGEAYKGVSKIIKHMAGKELFEVERFVTHEYNENNKLIRTINEDIIDPEDNSISEYKYNSDNNLIKQIIIWPNETPVRSRSIEYSYDSYGRLQNEFNYDNDGNQTETITYEYDSTGRLLKETRIEEDSSEITAINYTYNADGILERMDYYNNSKLDYYKVYEYDSKKRMIKVIKYNENNEAVTIMSGEYDNNGIMTKFIFDERYYSNEDYEVLTFKYDDKGRLIEQNSTYPNDIGTGYITTFTIYE